MKNILKSKLWFLFGGLIFLLGGINYYLKGDNTGAIIYILSSVVFFLGYWVQVKFNK